MVSCHVLGLPLEDADGDGFSDFSLIPVASAVYQDLRLFFDESVPELVPPDPCVAIDVSDGGPNFGYVHADLDRGTGDSFRNCAVFEDLSGNQPFLDDARTFSLVFDKADPFAGGCVCTTFSYLEENPHDVYDWPADSQWGTGFAQDANTCRITPAAGPILSSHESS